MKSSHFPQIYTLFDYFKEKVIFTPLFWEIFGKPRKNRYTEATGHTAIVGENIYVATSQPHCENEKYNYIRPKWYHKSQSQDSDHRAGMSYHRAESQETTSAFPALRNKHQSSSQLNPFSSRSSFLDGQEKKYT